VIVIRLHITKTIKLNGFIKIGDNCRINSFEIEKTYTKWVTYIKNGNLSQLRLKSSNEPGVLLFINKKFDGI
jgi:hypothetical protein